MRFGAVRGMPRTFWVLWVATFINKLGGFVVPFLALYLTEARGLSVEATGIVLSLFGAGALLAGPVGGFCADRLGRRTTALWGMVLGSAAMVALGLQRAPDRIAWCTLALGLFGNLYRAPVSAMVADLVPAADRTRAYGLLYWAINLGFAISTFLAGALAKAGFTLLFVGDAATTLACAAIFWLRVPETRPSFAPTERLHSGWAPYRHLSFLGLCALTLLVAVVFQQNLVTLPLDMRSHGISPSEFGALISTNGITIVILQPLALPLIERLRRTRVLAASALLMGIGFGLTAITHSAAGYIATIVVWTIGEIGLSTVGPAVAADCALESVRGAYLGAYQLAWSASILFAPALGSLVLGRLGAGALWGGCLAVCAAAAAGFLLLAERI